MALIQLTICFTDFKLLPLEVVRHPVYLNDELLHNPNMHFHPVSAFSIPDAFLCIPISSEHPENTFKFCFHHQCKTEKYSHLVLEN